MLFTSARADESVRIDGEAFAARCASENEENWAVVKNIWTRTTAFCGFDGLGWAGEGLRSLPIKVVRETVVVPSFCASRPSGGLRQTRTGLRVRVRGR